MLQAFQNSFLPLKISYRISDCCANNIQEIWCFHTDERAIKLNLSCTSLPFLVSLLLLALMPNSVLLGSCRKCSDRPCLPCVHPCCNYWLCFSVLKLQGSSWACPAAAPTGGLLSARGAFLQLEVWQGPRDTWEKQWSSGEESGSEPWDPLHSAQHNLVCFISFLLGMWNREHLEVTWQPLK